MNRRTRIAYSKVRAAVTELGTNATNREIADAAGVSVATAHKYGAQAKSEAVGDDLNLPDANTPKATEHALFAKFKGKCDQCGEKIAPGDDILVDDDPANRLPGGKRGRGRKPIRHETCPVGGDHVDSPEPTDTRNDDQLQDQPVSPEAKDLDDQLDKLDDLLKLGTGDAQAGDREPTPGQDQNSSDNPISQDDDPNQGQGDDPDDRWVLWSELTPIVSAIQDALKDIQTNLASMWEGITKNERGIDILDDQVDKLDTTITRHEEKLDDHTRQLDDHATQILDQDERIRTLEKRPHGDVKLTIEVPEWSHAHTFEEGEHFHENFELALTTLKATNHLWLGGPTGGGKTHMAEQIAKALGLDFYMYSCTQGMLESKFEGKRWLDGEFQTTAWIEWGENGGVMLIDEADAMNDNVRLLLNSFLANGRMALPNRIDNPIMIRHEKALIILGTNTWGAGANGDYTGRDTIDLATRDRFAAMKVELGYDRELEQKLLGDQLEGWETLGNGKPWRPEALHSPLGQALEQIRANIETYSIPSQALSTRTKLNAARLLASKVEAEDILQMYFTGWDGIDRNKALEGVSYSEAN
jgi:MoxR-like ATPase